MKFENLALLVFVAACSKENPDYDLGFEDGCAVGKYDAYDCRAKNPKIKSLDESEEDYPMGYFDGYNECYETATLMSDCTDWSKDTGYYGNL